MKDHTYRPRRLLSIFGPACMAERETTGRPPHSIGCIDKQLARPGVLAVLLPRAEAERVVQLLDDLADRLADEAAMEAALFQLEDTL